MARIKVNKNAAAPEPWQAAHNLAIDWPKGFEVPLVRGLHFWQAYAELHRKQYGTPIGDADPLISEAWQDWGEAMRDLLGGESGRLNCGTLDSFILDTMREQGFTHLSGGDKL